LAVEAVDVAAMAAAAVEAAAVEPDHEVAIFSMDNSLAS
jgi:hypothetical protein